MRWNIFWYSSTKYARPFDHYCNAIFIPVVFLLDVYACEALCRNANDFVLFASGMLLWNVVCSIEKVKENKKTAAYTPDWKNF